MTTELYQVLIANGILTLTTLILTPILLWAIGYSWHNQRSL